MKTLNLSVNTDGLKEDPKPSIIQIWENFILGGCQSTYKEGLNLKMQCQLMSIMNKLKKVTDDATNVLELEDAEFDIFKNIAEKGKFLPNAYKVLSQISEKINEVK